MQHGKLDATRVTRYWRLFCLAAVVGAMAGRSAAGAQSQETPPTFPAGVELITIDAVVVDSEGHLVPGLTRDDFVVREEGRTRKIESFEAISLRPALELGWPEEPARSPVVATNTPEARGGERAFAVLVDDLGITRPETQYVQRGVESFLASSVAAGDEVTLLTTSGSVWWSTRIPDGREDLRSVLGRVEGSRVDRSQTDQMTEYEAFWINTYEHGASIPGDLAAFAATGSVKQRVVRRYLERGLCGNVNFGAVANCEGVVKGIASGIDGERRQRDRITLQAVRRAFDAVAPVHGRKSLLLFSPGFVQDNELPLGEVRTASRETNTAVYFIDVRGLVGDGGIGSADVSQPWGDPREEHRMRFEQANLTSAGAQDLAEDTGGFSVRNTNDLAGGARRIANESRVFYLLGFSTSEEDGADGWRKLQVEVNNPDLTVRARRGYRLRSVVASAEKESAKKTKRKKDDEESEPTPVVAAALDSVHTLPGIPLRAMVYVLEPRADGLTHVLVAAELDARQLAVTTEGRQRVAHLEVSIAATHRDTGRGFWHNESKAMKVGDAESLGWRGLVREFELASGVNQARVVVRDESTGAMGAVTQRFEVPPPDELRLSTPILTDRLVPAKDGQSRPQPALGVHRTFPASGALYCKFEVFGAMPDPRTGAPHVAAGLEIRMGNGRVVQRTEPTPIEPDADGRLVRTVGMGLEGMEAGPYEFAISIRDEVSGAPLEDWQPFTIAPSAP